MFGFKSKERKTTDFFLDFADYCAQCFVFDDDPENFGNELEAPLALNSRLKNAGFDEREQIIFSTVVLTAVTMGVMCTVAKVRLNEKELEQFKENNLPGGLGAHFLYIACEEKITSTIKRWFGDAASSGDISLYFLCAMRDPIFQELTSRGLDIFNRWLECGWGEHRKDLGKIAMNVYIREIYDDEDLISTVVFNMRVDEQRRLEAVIECIEDPDERLSGIKFFAEETLRAQELRESQEDSDETAI